MKKYPEVVELATKVLKSDSMNVKALVRRAQANLAMMDFELAEQDIKKALEIDPHNRDVALEKKTLRQKQAAHRQKEAKLYGNMFERMRRMEEKELKKPEVKSETLPQGETADQERLLHRFQRKDITDVGSANLARDETEEEKLVHRFQRRDNTDGISSAILARVNTEEEKLVHRFQRKFIIDVSSARGETEEEKLLHRFQRTDNIETLP